MKHDNKFQVKINIAILTSFETYGTKALSFAFEVKWVLFGCN